MKTKIGRNDLCYCGSGRKYKYCHLLLDEQPKPLEVPSARPAQTPRAPRHLPVSLGDLGKVVQETARRAPASKQSELAELLAELQPMLAYEQRREEICAASAELETHRAEYKALIQDREGYRERAWALFDEDCFAPLRFTVSDVVRAFDKVGYPAPITWDEEAIRTMAAAILHLADKDRRMSLSRSLLLLLPKFVAERRFLDGWVIQGCAQMTGEESDESNPFLFHMFRHGYEAWEEQRRSKDMAVLRTLEMDPDRLQSMSLEEIDAWLKDQQKDPKTAARIEAQLEAHPELRAEAIANCQAADRDFAKLLERDVARGLLLTDEELQSVLPIFSRGYERAVRTHPELFADRGKEPPTQALADVIWPMLGEMAQAVFTTQRLEQLIAQLRLFRAEQFAAGDKRAAACAHAAISSLEREKNPAGNYHITALCFVSLRTLFNREAPGGR